MNDHQYILEHNRASWDKAVDNNVEWTVPVSPEIIAAARRGEWHIILTPVKPVPREWFGTVDGARILCLASGGGQQGPVLAAAGAQVTVFDNSPRQLAQDRSVAEREGLHIETVQGDMADLSAFDDASFDLVVQPASNCFAPEILPVFREVHRVLVPGGAFLLGFSKPVLYIFDEELEEQGILQVRHTLPYSDMDHPEVRRRRTERGEPLEFSHTLEQQIGGQLEAGLVLTGFYEDTWHVDRPLARYMPPFIATRAVKPVAAQSM